MDVDKPTTEFPEPFAYPMRRAQIKKAHRNEQNELIHPIDMDMDIGPPPPANTTITTMLFPFNPQVSPIPNLTLLNRRVHQATAEQIFGGNQGYSYTSFSQAMLLYEEHLSDHEFDDVCKEVASLVALYPDVVSLLRQLGQHTVAFLFTCEIRCVWEMVLKTAGLSKTVKIVGGGRMSDGFVMTAKTKAILVSRLRRVHHFYVWAMPDAIEADELKSKHLKGQRRVVLMDSVVNNGKTMVDFVQHIRNLDATISIVLVAGVVQVQSVSAGSILGQFLQHDKALSMVALRLSENKFTGRGQATREIGYSPALAAATYTTDVPMMPGRCHNLTDNEVMIFGPDEARIVSRELWKISVAGRRLLEGAVLQYMAEKAVEMIPDHIPRWARPLVEQCILFHDFREIVDFLDVVDPEVATLSSITNIQNSLFIPSLGKWINRRPTYDLSNLPRIPGAFPPSKESLGIEGRAEEEEVTGARSPSLSSVLSAPQYAILPTDASLEGWPEEDVKVLNDYVRHMLHSRRSKIKQRFKAFGKYASKPLGFLVTLYATLITLFGLAWVLFLIGWIYVGEKQLYVINVIDYVLVALFAIVGDGLAPFRAVDTYHMFFVAHYHRKTWKMRRKLLLPDLKDHNDLPTENGEGRAGPDVEAQHQEHVDEFVPVLTDKEQERLVHHQAKLAKSHTFYKPHETETHKAFPLRLLITVVLLLDLHSCLQISLGACTWGIPYEVRPAAVTTTILCCSIATNILAGILISVGDRRTRKRDVLERLLKQDLTGEAMKKIEKKKEKEAQKDEIKRDSEEGGNKAGRTSLTASLSIPPWRKSSEQDRDRDQKWKTSARNNKRNTSERDYANGNGLRIPGSLP
ncbi:hypothetical protein N0V88_008078 [Collariella sp. IMI 366227]|nr:hypothetical protein N0V88_008078 [Collariella sp. IMI 366227]